MININKESSDCRQMKKTLLEAGGHEEKKAFEKLKGVVPQQNGNWGAQIYANHQRIWLGTFKTQREAAMAYDSASIKLRSGESHRNFPWSDQTVEEPHFQSHYSAEAVVSMIRDGTYPSNFATFLSTAKKQKQMSLKDEEEEFCCTQLFQKELTPSDVGKLNRLVIPKKHAITYFPYVCGNGNDEVEVVFYDKLVRLWKFRYCYWKSSQSYVLTRGWNRFVKDKKLKAKDVIAFSMGCRKGGEGEAFAFIHVIYNDAAAEEISKGDDKLVLGNHALCSEEDGKAQKGLRLFGVSIT
ncbi:hypothetical protein VNO78_18728 [Psophocarpus tetragonolobus]|uniref:AP2/ERF and B3 domain-containing transcription factor n=1 Tax=Psophocarpus tetragonolobus TaxID=3891 RepID=A0AAN9S7Y1_PSOTE